MGYKDTLPPRRLKVGDEVTYKGLPHIVTKTEGSFYGAMTGKCDWLVTVYPKNGGRGSVVAESDVIATDGTAPVQVPTQAPSQAATLDTQPRPVAEYEITYTFTIGWEEEDFADLDSLPARKAHEIAKVQRLTDAEALEVAQNSDALPYHVDLSQVTVRRVTP